jgi:ubiquinone/menaquinone biosynthesis C-methylase UbiE
MRANYSEYYADGAARYDALRLDRVEEIEVTSTLFDRVLNERPCDILEIGCGTGRYGAALQKLGHRVVGMDLSIAQLSRVGNRLSGIICASAGMMPIFGKAIHACLAVLMLHQMSSQERELMFAEVFRVVGVGGLLGIKTCSHDDLATRWVEGYFPSAARINRERYPSLELLSNELSRAGFRVENIIPTQTVTSVSASDLMTAVMNRHNTTLRMIPSAEFENGSSSLRDAIAGIANVDVPQAHTHVFCRAVQT